MLRITAVEKAKKKGYHLFVEEEYALTISAEVLAQTGLAAGQQITPQRLDEIRQLCDRQRARERALYLLESRSHSRKELFDKLCRSVPEQTAAEVTQRMEDLGLVDDEAYARRWAATLICRKYARHLATGDPKDRSKAVNGLLRLGYDYGQIRTALRNLSETEE